MGASSFTFTSRLAAAASVPAVGSSLRGRLSGQGAGPFANQLLWDHQLEVFAEASLLCTRWGGVTSVATGPTAIASSQQLPQPCGAPSAESEVIKRHRNLGESDGVVYQNASMRPEMG